MSGYKRTGCFLLVLILVFMTFANPLATQARAEPITLAVGTAATLITLLAMIGITFATVDLAKQAAQSFVNANPDIWDDINRIQVGGGGNGDPGGNRPGFFFDVANTAGAITILNRLKSFFGDGVGGEGSIKVPSKDVYQWHGVRIYDVSPNSSYAYLFDIAPYSIGSVCKITRNGIDLNYRLVQSGSKVTLFRNDHPVYYRYNAVSLQHNPYETCIYKMLFVVCRSAPTVLWVNPVILAKATDINTGKVTYRFAGTMVDTYDNDSGSLYISSTGELGTVINHIPYKNSSKYPLGNIISALPDAVNKQGTIVVDTTDTVNDLNNNPDTSPKVTQDTVLIDTGLKDILEQIKQGQEEDDFDAPKLPGGELLEKFPFCVPFDLFRIVQALNATPKAPKWTIPIKFDSLDYYEEYDFDLSEFETLVHPIRWGLTLIFLLGLIVVSRKMIKG